MTDLVTTSDLGTFLGRSLDATRAAAAVSLSSGLIRGYTRQWLSLRTLTANLLLVDTGPQGYRINFPQRPLIAVTSVSIWGTALVSGDDYAWDGVSPWVDIPILPEQPTGVDVLAMPPRATVTYQAGYATLPADIKAVALACAGRVYENPRGLRSRSIGDYSETYGGTDDAVSGAGLLTAEMAVLDGYRLRAGSVKIR